MKLNRKRLVIVLEDQIYLYDIQTMKLLYTIETSPNPNGKLFTNPCHLDTLTPNPKSYIINCNFLDHHMIFNLSIRSNFLYDCIKVIQFYIIIYYYSISSPLSKYELLSPLNCNFLDHHSVITLSIRSNFLYDCIKII